MSLGMEVGLGRGHIVLDGDPAPLFKKEAQLTQFSAHVCCGQTAGWMIKMLLGAMVGLGPGNIVLDADPAQPSRGTAPPKIWPMSLVAKQLDGSRCHLVRGRPLWLLSFYLFSSPTLSGQRLVVYHTSTHDVALVRI